MNKTRVVEIYQSLKKKIISKEYAFGNKIPSIRQLANHYKASFQTILKAIILLEKEGLVTRYATYGIFAGKKDH